MRLLPFCKTAHRGLPLALLVPSHLGLLVALDLLEDLAVGVVQVLEEFVLDEPGPAGDRPALVVGDLARCSLGGAACLPGGAKLGPAAEEGCCVELLAGNLWYLRWYFVWWLIWIVELLAGNLWFLRWLSTAALAAKSGSHLASCSGDAVDLTWGVGEA